MQKFIGLTAALLFAGPLAVTHAQTPAAADRIAEAVQILPADLRAGATVVTYDKATGARQVLRQGTNFVECQPRMDDGFTRCYNKALGPRRDLEAKLRRRRKPTRRSRTRSRRPPRPGTLKAPAPA